MCVCVYIYMCVCVYIYIYVCVCVCVLRNNLFKFKLIFYLKFFLLPTNLGAITFLGFCVVIFCSFFWLMPTFRISLPSIS